MPVVMHLERHAQLARPDLTAELTMLLFAMPRPLQTNIVVVVPHCLAAMLL
jgi:hypothetical protein